MSNDRLRFWWSLYHFCLFKVICYFLYRANHHFSPPFGEYFAICSNHPRMSILLASRIYSDLAMASHPFIGSPDLEPQWWFTLDIVSISKINPKMHWVWYNIRSLVYCTFLPSQILQLGRYFVYFLFGDRNVWRPWTWGDLLFGGISMWHFACRISWWCPGLASRVACGTLTRRTRKIGTWKKHFSAEAWGKPGNWRKDQTQNQGDRDLLGTCLDDDCLVYDFRCGWNSAEKNILQFGHFFQTSSWRFIVSSCIISWWSAKVLCLVLLS